MKNIYDATEKEKLEIIEIQNEDIIYKKRWHKTNIEDLVMVRTTNQFPVYGIVKPTDIDQTTREITSNWTFNSGILSNKNFIIIEPFKEQVLNPNLSNINEVDTWFNGDVKLSERAIILIPLEKYIKLCENPRFKVEANKFNIALFRGDENLALKMLLYDKLYASFDIKDSEFMLDEYGESLDYITKLKKLQEQIAEELQSMGRNVTYDKTHEYDHDAAVDTTVLEEKGEDTEVQIEDIVTYPENIEELNSRMITGLTSVVEGDIELDENCYATTAVGRRRENQEDAVILIKDEEIPEFKMMIVADGMGGEQKGELASHIIVTELKKWFESLTEENKKYYYSDVAGLEEKLKDEIQRISFDVDWQLYGLGGATVVCALIGERDTLITNVGDSRAYVIKNGRLEQVSIDDAIVQEEFDKGNIPYKDAMRFHHDAAGITQCVGMGKIENIHSKTIENNEYDMLLLFSDGVTDCLSEDDIAVICKKTDRTKVAKMLVQKAIEHDSIGPDILYEDYFDFELYIPGGKDNTTSAIFIPSEEDDKNIEAK